MKGDLYECNDCDYFWRGRTNYRPSKCPNCYSRNIRLEKRRNRPEPISPPSSNEYTIVKTNRRYISSISSVFSFIIDLFNGIWDFLVKSIKTMSSIAIRFFDIFIPLSRKLPFLVKRTINLTVKVISIMVKMVLDAFFLFI